jgi:tellurite resistance protein TerC
METAAKASMSTRRAVRLSVLWLAFGVAAGALLLLLEGSDTAVSYWTVYFLERTLSLDNVFIFLLILGYFGLSGAHARRVVWYAIAGALVLRAVAIALGVQLIETFSWISYVLGALLIAFAVRMLRPDSGEFDPDSNGVTRLVRRVIPVTSGPDPRRFSTTTAAGRRAITPTGLALVAMIAADITFAVDSIPAAFGITLEVIPIWLANATALVGLIPLLVLVRALVRRFRYMSQTLAVVLAFIGARLLLEHVVTLGPLPTLAIVLGILAAGAAVSAFADRADPPSPVEEERRRPPRCPPAVNYQPPLPEPSSGRR